MGVLINYPLFHATDGHGVPLIGGKLYTYAAGTTTDKATFTSYTLATENANPVVLDTRGEATIYGSGIYKLVLKNSDDVTIWTEDNIELHGDGIVETMADLVGREGVSVRDTVTLLGFYAAGDGGGGPFYWDSTQAKSGHNGGTIIDPDHTSTPGDAGWYTAMGAGGDGCWMRETSNSWLTAWFGGVDGSSLNNILDAIVTAIPDKSTLHFPTDADFTLSSSITIDKSITIEGHGSYIAMSAGITFSGEIEDKGDIFSSAADAGDMSIDLSDVSFLSAGDYIILMDYSDYSFSDYRDYYKDGEFAKVKAISGSTVTLHKRLESSYGTAADYVVHYITPITPQINNLSVRSTHDGTPIVMRETLNAEMHNFKVEAELGSNAISVVRAIDMYVGPGCEFYNYNTDVGSLGYGFAQRGVVGTVMRGVTMYSRRHASTVTAGGQTIDVPVSRHLRFYDCTFTSFGDVTNTHAADFHGPVVDGKYINCTFYGGVVLGGRNAGVFGGVAYSNIAQGALWLREVEGGSFTFDGVTVVQDTTAGSALVGSHASSEMEHPNSDVVIGLYNLDVTINSDAGDQFVSVPWGTDQDLGVSVIIKNVKSNKYGVTRLIYIWNKSAGADSHVKEIFVSGIDFSATLPTRWLQKLSTFIKAGDTRLTLPPQTEPFSLIVTTADRSEESTSVTFAPRHIAKNLGVTITVYDHDHEATGYLLITNDAIAGDGDDYYYYTKVQAQDVNSELAANTTINGEVTLRCDNIYPIE